MMPDFVADILSAGRAAVMGLESSEGMNRVNVLDLGLDADPADARISADPAEEIFEQHMTSLIW